MISKKKKKVKKRK